LVIADPISSARAHRLLSQYQQYPLATLFGVAYNTSQWAEQFVTGPWLLARLSSSACFLF
jgi:hypothetical protein